MDASGSLHGSYLMMRVWRPQTEIAPFQAGGETQWYDFNFNATSLLVALRSPLTLPWGGFLWHPSAFAPVKP